MTIPIVSSSFHEGGWIPAEHTGDGVDMSPPLAWGQVPETTRSIALICDDLDAPRGTWTNWVLYNIRPEINTLPASMPHHLTLPMGGEQGVNDYGNVGYGGPQPPSSTHRYAFTVYALDEVLPLEGGATKARVLEAMDGHVLATGQLTGQYRHQQR